MTTTATRPSIPAERFQQRLARACAATAEHSLDALLIGVGADLRYLTGYVAMPMHNGTPYQLTKVDTHIHAPWTGPNGEPGHAEWAYGWAHVLGTWVRQSMVARIVPDDKSIAPIVFLSGL